MSGYNYFYQQISSWTTVDTRLSFFTDTDTLSIVDTGRNRYLDFSLSCDISGTTAIRTFVFDYFTGTITIRTGLDILHRSKERLLCKHNFSFTTALGTCFRICSRFCTCTMAGCTLILQNHFNFFLTSKNSLFKCDPYTGTEIGTFHRSVIASSSGATATEEVAENISKDISHIHA